ncbi:localization factor PodJL [Methylopila capsulata]|uniref:Localization factor PodJL n=1 Tax=Methylopila capsulata TaxID=61654 RepID=A0ABS2T4S5_9HYPH|nr:tetratricopeptide repeat protein [Methylopila capsulata]MBM7851168.1 localization factor PodJL [Methylopila capsulata]
MTAGADEADAGGHRLERLAERLSDARRDGDSSSPLPELEQLVSMLAQRNIQTEDRLANALEGLARWVERSDANAPAAQAAVAALEPVAPAPAPSAEPSAGDLEARLTVFARTLTEAPAPAPIPPAEPAPKATQPGSLRAALAEIAARQKDLDANEEAPPLPAAVAPDAAQAPAAPMVDPIAVAGLREEIETLGSAIRDMPTRAEVDGLAREMAALAARLGEDRPARLDSVSLMAIDTLVSEVDRMRGDAASPQMLARFADELGAVAARLDHLTPASPELFDTLAQRIEQVREELTQFPPMAAVESLATEIQAVLARLDAQERAAAPTQQAVAELSGKVAVLGGKIDGIAAAAEQRAEEAERMGQAVRAELATLSSADAMESFSRQIENLTAKLESRRQQGLSTDELGAKIPALIDKIDELTATSDARSSDAERVAEAVRAELAAIAQPAAKLDDIGRRIEALTLELARRPSGSDGAEAIAGKIDGLGVRLEAVAAAARARGASAERVEEAVRGIAEHLIATAQADAGGAKAFVGIETFGGLETRIEQVVDGLDRAGGRLDDLNAGFAALAARVEQAAAEAGRNAVAALRADVGQSATPLADGSDQLAHALLEIKAAAKRDDRRTSDTLDAVRLTLERLIDRMEAIDEALNAQGVGVGFAEHRSAFDDRPQTAPGPRVDATEAARAAARRAMEEIDASGDLAARFGRPPADAAFRPVADLAADHPLEPGAALRAERRTDGLLDAPHERQPEGPSGEVGALSAAALIASARRAVTRPAPEAENVIAELATDERRSRAAGVMAVLKARRRPILLGIAAALIVLGVLKAATSINDHGAETAAEPAAPTAESAPPAQPAPQLQAPEPAPQPAPAAPAEPQPVEPAPAPKPRAEVAPPRAKAADITDFAFSQTLDPSGQKFTAPPKSDDIVTGSINRGDALPDSIGGSMLRLRAVQGDPSAQLEIADRLAAGRGVEADPVAAARWLEKAAVQGLAPAQHRLGSLYEKGRGVPRDLAIARRWYEQAAASGNVRAMHNLGVLHAEGGLGKPDFGAAIVWFRMAAERGLVDSQYNLAVLEARGLGGKRDLADAYKWFSLASAQGDQDAGRKRADVAKALGAANVASADQLVTNFKPRAVDPAANEVPTPPGGWDQASANSAAAPMQLR